VFPFLTNAELMPKMEIAVPASRDTTLLKVSVSSLHQTTLTLLTSDAPLGTGITRSALPVPTAGCSTEKEFVCLSLTSAVLTLRMETVLSASRDTILSMASVSSLHSILLNPQTLDVPLGIGTTKFV
jgi:hypothetical protein